ncbi:MAG: sulfite exporter TauE/SafE family protein [Acidobacteriota bacterium]|nr:sulfite exporter TauE/SafE family protein [Acidobacteriota bacterium]MDH3529977.1 sulfite exporter TauE/SafE family protein [Acidobacteriota bacterium]
MMPIGLLILLIVLFFVTTAVGVVTGSNSLITVPVMFEMGIEPKTAIATNMFGLTFMAIGATIPFYRKGLIDVRGLAPFVGLTLVGSAIGAFIVGLVKADWIPFIISAAMIAIGLFILFRRDTGSDAGKKEITTRTRIGVFIAAFLLAIYGGFYSGGYMTVLTAVFVAFAGMSFSEAIAGTKFLNLFSSSIATLVFMWQGFVDYKLGLILAVTMFVAAYVGAKTVTRLNDIWLKRIFLVVIFGLAAKMLLF